MAAYTACKSAYKKPCASSHTNSCLHLHRGKKKKLWEFAVTRATKQENETFSIVRETDKCKNRLPFLQVYFGT